jgi:hypothetical protein
MTLTRNRWLLVLGTLILALSLILIFVGLPALQRQRLSSCVYWLGGDLAENSHKLDKLGPGDGNWYTLNAEEGATVLSEIPYTNCANDGSPLSDTVNKSMEIAIQRDKAKQGYTVMVWLKGPDNRSGTDDDVLAFPDDRPPIQK